MKIIYTILIIITGILSDVNYGLASINSLESGFNNLESATSNDCIVINEFMASNDLTVTDPDGEFEDWIELYNNGTETVDLSGYFLSDDNSDLTQWAFPQGVTLSPDNYLIIWADGDLDQDGLHADFRLSASGESIILSNSNGITIIDAIDYPEQTTDISYARIPNGTGDFQASAPTFNSSNDSVIDCTNAGGDIDNDGICGDEDCNDMDASVGAAQPEGTACDDDNAMTQNDVIQSDGCTCQGSDIVSTSPIVINEFMASNDITVADPDGEFEDWIELYNNGIETVDLSGYFLSDDDNDLTKWSFPGGTDIGPDSYLIIWADEDLDQDGLHADFRLSASGESIILSNSVDTSVVDAIDYPEQETDISYGRFPNGTGDFQFMNPTTFNAENTIRTSTNEFSENINIKIYPNPTEDYFFLEYSDNNFQENIVTITNSTGIVIYRQVISGKTMINTSYWASGMYIINSEYTVVKLVKP